MPTTPWTTGKPYTPPADAVANRIVNEAAKIAFANLPTVAASRDLAMKVIHHRIKGDLVECGVADGAQCAVMADVIRNSGEKDRVVHLFDSFQGIPEAGPKDDETITGLIGRPKGKPKLKSTGHVACSRAQVEGHMRRMGLSDSLFVYHEGWFQNTVKPFADAAERPIALLRLDGDLFESTKVCLDALYDLVPKNGIVVVDDFALTGCRRACEEFLSARGAPFPDIHEIVGGGGPVFWRKP